MKMEIIIEVNGRIIKRMVEEYYLKIILNMKENLLMMNFRDVF